DQIVPMLLGIILALIALSRTSEIHHSQIAISAACILTFIGSLAVLSITGLSWHHLQILYIPSIIVVVSLTSLPPASAAIARLRTLAVIFLIGLMMAGTLTWTLIRYKGAIRSFREVYAELNELSPETRRLLAIGTSGTYARLGINDDRGHAVGLSNW